MNKKQQRKELLERKLIWIENEMSKPENDDDRKRFLEHQLDVTKKELDGLKDI